MRHGLYGAAGACVDFSAGTTRDRDGRSTSSRTGTKRRSDEGSGGAQVERETTYRTVTEPAMTARSWLREFTTKLKELQPRLRIAHTLPGYGEVAGYVEHEYDLREARQPSSREITLSFGCVVAPSECPNVQVEGANRVRAISALFQRYRLGGPLAPQKDASGETTSATFKAKGRIPLEASFQSDTGSGQLRIAFKLRGFRCRGELFRRNGSTRHSSTKSAAICCANRTR